METSCRLGATLQKKRRVGKIGAPFFIVVEIFKSDVSFFANIFAGFYGVFKRISLGGVLFRLNDIPAVVVARVDYIENRREVNIAVAGNREHTRAHSVEEAHIFSLDAVADFHADIF